VPDAPPEIDTSIAHEARVYDYLLGGTNNYPVDREAAQASAVAFGGIDNSRHAVRANRLFLGRVVRHLADSGFRQFLDIGTGIPTANNVHQVAQALAPESRVVYVDNDALVLAHANALLTSSPEGVTSYIQGDLREPDTILAEAAKTLDLSKPVALMLISLLHFFPDGDDPYATVRAYVDALAPGSVLAASHLAKDIQPEGIAALAKVSAENPAFKYTFFPRTHDEFARFFDGLELVEPGVVQVDRWRPIESVPAPGVGVGESPFHGGVGRKP
jgi:SAM-dependent methyltransferase